MFQRTKYGALIKQNHGKIIFKQGFILKRLFIYQYKDNMVLQWSSLVVVGDGGG